MRSVSAPAMMARSHGSNSWTSRRRARRQDGVSSRSWSSAARKGEAPVDYRERLRRLAINDARLGEDCSERGIESPELDPKALALVRFAALVAIGGADPSYGAQADAAVSAGATAAEIVDVLFGVVPVVGLPARGRGRPEGGDGARLRHRRRLRIPLRGVSPLPAEQTRRRRLLHRLVARGDAQLSIDRAHLGVDGIAGHEEPVGDVANREMGLQVREEAQLSRSEG